MCKWCKGLTPICPFCGGEDYGDDKRERPNKELSGLPAPMNG